MAEERAVENGRICKFEGLVTLTLDRVVLRTFCISHRPLPTCQISLKSKQLLWTDGRTYIRTDGRTFEIGFIRPTLSKSRGNNALKHLVAGVHPVPREELTVNVQKYY